MQLCAVGIRSIDLDRSGVAADRQHESQWCWAATLSALFAYYGHPMSQERIVRETFGALRNAPAQAPVLMSALNRDWTDDNGRRFRAYGELLRANASAAAPDLENGHPLIVATQRHAMLLTELSWWHDRSGRVWIREATVRDPWPFDPQRRQLTLQEWRATVFVVRVRISAIGDVDG